MASHDITGKRWGQVKKANKRSRRRRVHNARRMRR